MSIGVTFVGLPKPALSYVADPGIDGCKIKFVMYNNM